MYEMILLRSLYWKKKSLFCLPTCNNTFFILSAIVVSFLLIKIVREERRNGGSMCSKLIKPSAPTPPHHRILKLSPVDQVQHSIKTPVLVYYSGSTGTEDDDVESRNERLQTSLSETLARFYPLAGRYVKEGNWVDCNDEGAEYLEAKVKGRLSEVLSFRNEEMIVDNQVPLAGGPLTSPTLSVQINMFDCGGLVIVTRCSHHIFDGFSASSFMTCWATAFRHCIDDTKIWPFFELSSILPAKDLPLFKPLPPRLAPGDIAARRFVLDRAKILSLKARAHDPSFQREPTRVEVVTALIWRALMGVSRAKHGRLRSSLAYHAMNLRPKIIPPLPPVSCGNLQSRVIARWNVAAAEHELPELNDLVGILIDTFSKAKQTAVVREDVYSTLLKTRNETHEAVEKGEEDAFMFTSWCGFPFYQLDFGWGKPVWVSRMHSPNPSTCLVDTQGGDGIEAWVTLAKHDMPRFLQDDLILAITSEHASCASLIPQHPCTGPSTASGS